MIDEQVVYGEPPNGLIVGIPELLLSPEAPRLNRPGFIRCHDDVQRMIEDELEILRRVRTINKKRLNPSVPLLHRRQHQAAQHDRTDQRLQ